MKRTLLITALLTTVVATSSANAESVTATLKQDGKVLSILGTDFSDGSMKQLNGQSQPQTQDEDTHFTDMSFVFGPVDPQGLHVHPGHEDETSERTPESIVVQYSVSITNVSGFTQTANGVVLPQAANIVFEGLLEESGASAHRAFSIDDRSYEIEVVRSE